MEGRRKGFKRTGGRGEGGKGVGEGSEEEKKKGGQLDT